MSKEKLLINNPSSNNSEDMSNKQIEEMAEIMCRHRPNLRFFHSDAMKLSEALYNAGYCKPSLGEGEGEWVKVYQNDMATVYKCSRCHHLSFGTSDYCICGAKMKGR